MDNHERKIAQQALLELADQVEMDAVRPFWTKQLDGENLAFSGLTAEAIRKYAHRTYARRQITIGGCVVTEGDEHTSWRVGGARIPAPVRESSGRLRIKWLVGPLSNALRRDLTPAEYTALWNFCAV